MCVCVWGPWNQTCPVEENRILATSDEREAGGGQGNGKGTGIGKLRDVWRSE